LDHLPFRAGIAHHRRDDVFLPPPLTHSEFIISLRSWWNSFKTGSYPETLVLFRTRTPNLLCRSTLLTKGAPRRVTERPCDRSVP
jgi:hypothetical protein